MSKRVSVGDKLNSVKKESPRDELFKSTEEQEVKTESKKNSEDLRRQTYYVTEELVDALMMYKAFENKDKSVVVREALYAYIPEEYLEKARNKKK